MLATPKEPRIPLPKGWQGCVKSAVRVVPASVRDLLTQT